jgi:FkbM family methyltransferase
MGGYIDGLAKSRIAYPLRKLADQVARRWPFPVQASLTGGQSMWIDLRSAVGRAILVKGEFDHAVWRAIEAVLAPGGVLVDVGANVGYYTVLGAQRVGAAGQVHAFEIDPRPLRCLRRNAAARPNVQVHEIAIGEADGEGVLVSGLDSGHSSVKAGGEGPIVPMTSLDHWLETPGAPVRIDVIKIDIEGGELAALRGARTLLKRFSPVVVCESWEDGSSQLIAFFEQAGYATEFLAGVHTPTILARPKP